MQHVTVYRDKERFAGWPANYGIWSWGDEIVVGFTAGFHRLGTGFHTQDRDRPFEPMQARSLDGGLTWEVQPTPCRMPGNRGFSADEHVNAEWKVAPVLNAVNAPIPCPGGIDFTHPDFALMIARTGLGGGAVSWFYISYDRCHAWEGPYRLPTFGEAGVDGRTDYQVLGRNDCLLFLSAGQVSGHEGGTFCARTRDGGRTFEWVSWVVASPLEGFAIMPASVRLPSLPDAGTRSRFGGSGRDSASRLLVAIRCAERVPHFYPGVQNWIDLYASKNDGATWQFVGRPVADTGCGGNPATLTRLHDGRLCLIYGYRNPPYGMRARLSNDRGESWSDEIVLRADAGDFDIGYPRTVLRPDATVVMVYYYNDHPQTARFIAATLWKP